MINEALSYEPTTTHGYSDDMERRLTEKPRNSYSSVGSSGSANGPPHMYAGPSAAGGYYSGQEGAYGYEREYPAYAPRSPNPAYDVTRPYGPSYGGAAYDVNRVPQGNAMGAPAMPVYVPSTTVPQPAVHSNGPSVRVPAPAMSPNLVAGAATQV